MYLCIYDTSVSRIRIYVSMIHPYLDKRKTSRRSTAEVAPVERVNWPLGTEKMRHSSCIATMPTRYVNWLHKLWCAYGEKKVAKTTSLISAENTRTRMKDRPIMAKLGPFLSSVSNTHEADLYAAYESRNNGPPLRTSRREQCFVQTCLVRSDLPGRGPRACESWGLGTPSDKKILRGFVLNLGVEVWRTNLNAAASDVRRTNYCWSSTTDLVINNNNALDRC